MGSTTALNITAYDIAQRFIGTKEVPGTGDNAAIVAMLRLDGDWPKNDEVPWCSAFVNYIAWLLRLPRSKSLAARSWLGVGLPIHLSDAMPFYDVVVLSRDGDPDSGHVGFFSSLLDQKVYLLGGNQGNQVSVAPFDVQRVLGVRRLV